MKKIIFSLHFPKNNLFFDFLPSVGLVFLKFPVKFWSFGFNLLLACFFKIYIFAFQNKKYERG